MNRKKWVLAAAIFAASFSLSARTVYADAGENSPVTGTEIISSETGDETVKEEVAMMKSVKEEAPCPADKAIRPNIYGRACECEDSGQVPPRKSAAKAALEE